MGMDAIIEGIKKINSGSFTLIENNDSESSYYSFPQKKDVQEFLKSGKRFY